MPCNIQKKKGRVVVNAGAGMSMEDWQNILFKRITSPDHSSQRSGMYRMGVEETVKTSRKHCYLCLNHADLITGSLGKPESMVRPLNDINR